ncbi:dihydrolipoyl dehydrogenase [Rhizorhabdus wittichii]|uniref:Dihydrolipoyl dehydrogenase n=1 Tax=Rhizorhabdus wittichii TaxID=160791 RepID=A0A975D581_9SPHN|nr:dihydrolipoyl dehydrogenase [Rhizorhabdus wittichii]QTH23147.1 dihydrolipoyl dehydrogenase [Rhizorhabdus wittichii]
MTEPKTEIVKTRVLVLGGGPGGYVAAIRAGQLGLDTVLVEAGRLGGTCLIRGCIPSKALIHAAEQYAAMAGAATAPRLGISLASPPSLDFAATIGWKDGVVDRLNGGVAALLKRAKVRVIAGHGRFSDARTCHVATAEGGAVTVQAEHVVLATGSEPIELPFLPFGGKVISSTEALSLPAVPKRLAIVGAGYIGLELGIAYRKLGAEVTVVEAADRILPLYDAKLVEPVRRWLDRHGVALHLSARATGQGRDGLLVETTGGEAIELPADNILVTVGRRPVTRGWGLEEMAVAMDGSFVAVDDRCATATRNVWAIGDLVGEPMLAHKASAQGAMVAEIIAGRKRRFDPRAIPAVCFTEPEIVSVGQGPDAPGTITGVFPFAANGRALSMEAGDEGGFVRVVALEAGHRIVGVQAVGLHVSELSAAFAQAIETGAVLEDVEGIIHAHPTLGEAFHEAALKAMGHAIHA